MIEEIKGDASRPVSKSGNPIIIAHIVNNIGAWGRGFTASLSKRFIEIEGIFRRKILRLGDVQYIRISENLTVANLCAQNKVRSRDNPIPLVYSALDTCLSELHSYCLKLDKIPEIHMPRIGAGLAGGDWNIIRTMIEDHLNNLQVVIYNYD